MHNISNLFYFGTTFYMLRTVSPSIIRSLKLYIQHQIYVIQVLWLLASKQPQNLYVMYLMLYVQSQTPDDGRRDRPKLVEYFPISRPTDATCGRFLFSIYMCITLHVSSVKRSSSVKKFLTRQCRRQTQTQKLEAVCTARDS
jgi:hypothetical protein